MREWHAGPRAEHACKAARISHSPQHHTHDKGVAGVDLVGAGRLHAEGVTLVQGHQLGLQGKKMGGWGHSLRSSGQVPIGCSSPPRCSCGGWDRQAS